MEISSYHPEVPLNGHSRTSSFREGNDDVGHYTSYAELPFNPVAKVTTRFMRVATSGVAEGSYQQTEVTQA